jgi:4'-phosphopantetheinyl transferase
VTGRSLAAEDTPGDTDVWIVDLATSGAALIALEGARRLLTEPEIARAQRMKDARRRERWIAAHVALHLALIDRIGRPAVLADTAPATKPRVVDWVGDFSLSHSGDLATIATRAHGRVGIDVEVRRSVRIGPERRRLIEVAGSAALPGAPLPADDGEMRFLAAWTRLEAIGKMRATGIGALLETLGINANGPGPDAVAERTRRLMSDAADPVGLSIIDVGRYDAVAALATSPTSGSPRFRALPSDLARLDR